MTKTVLVTGATDGIGRQTALELVKRGALVWVHGRTLDKARGVADEIGARGAIAADLGSLEEVRALAIKALRDIRSIDVLVNNAGILESTRRESADGFELTFAVNHLAPFLLTHLLLPAMKRPGRIVNVSSGLHGSGRLDPSDLQRTRSYDGHGAYSGSKLANVLFTNELARRLHDPRLSVFALHPGIIGTKLLRQGFGGGGAAVETGARTTLVAALDEKLEGKTALYLSGGRVVESSRTSRDAALMKTLYDESCRLVGIEGLPDGTVG